MERKDRSFVAFASRRLLRMTGGRGAAGVVCLAFTLASVEAGWALAPASRAASRGLHTEFSKAYREARAIGFEQLFLTLRGDLGKSIAVLWLDKDKDPKKFKDALEFYRGQFSLLREEYEELPQAEKNVGEILQEIQWLPVALKKFRMEYELAGVKMAFAVDEDGAWPAETAAKYKAEFEALGLRFKDVLGVYQIIQRALEVIEKRPVAPVTLIDPFVDGAIAKGPLSKKEFKRRLREIRQNDITDRYRDRMIRLLERVIQAAGFDAPYRRRLERELAQLKRGTLRIYGFISIVKGEEDYFYGQNNLKEGELFLATDLIEKLDARDPLSAISLADEYLLHELLCPILGHPVAILIQRAIFPAHFQKPERPEPIPKGLFGSALRDDIRTRAQGLKEKPALRRVTFAEILHKHFRGKRIAAIDLGTSEGTFVQRFNEAFGPRVKMEGFARAGQLTYADAVKEFGPRFFDLVTINAPFPSVLKEAVEAAALLVNEGGLILIRAAQIEFDKEELSKEKIAESQVRWGDALKLLRKDFDLEELPYVPKGLPSGLTSLHNTLIIAKRKPGPPKTARGDGGFIKQGDAAWREFTARRREFEADDLTPHYQWGLALLLERALRQKRLFKKEALQEMGLPEDTEARFEHLLDQVNDPAFKVFGFPPIVKGPEDFVLGHYDLEDNHLFITPELIWALRYRGPPSRVQQYLLHELLCAVLGHAPAIRLQQKLFPWDYSGPAVLSQQNPDKPLKGDLGDLLRDFIDQGAAQPAVEVLQPPKPAPVVAQEAIPARRESGPQEKRMRERILEKWTRGRILLEILELRRTGEDLGSADVRVGHSKLYSAIQRYFPATAEESSWQQALEERAALDDLGLEVDPSSGRLSYGKDFRPVSLSVDLWLVRHGETHLIHEQSQKGDFFQGGTDVEMNRLTDTGRHQAARMGETLFAALSESIERGEEVVFLTSPLSRARETAQPLLDLARTRLGRELSIREEPELVEINFGEWSNRSYEEIRQQVGKVELNKARAYRELDGLVTPAGGENFVALLYRAKKFLDRLNREYPGKRIVLFGHGTFFNALRVLTGDPAMVSPEGFIDWRTRMLPLAEPFHLNEAVSSILPAAQQEEPAKEPGEEALRSQA